MNQNQKPERLKKKPIRLTLSQQARENIEKQILQDDSLATSISDLLEKIGLGEISVSRSVNDPQVELLRFPIYKRLVVLTQEPAAVMTSTIAFVLRMCSQLGLDSDVDSVLAVTKQGFRIAFSAGYTFPDLFVNNPSALLRWATFRILREKFLTSDLSRNRSDREEKIDKPIHRCLYKISEAIDGIRDASRSHKLEAFKMKAVDGFTISQILILFQVQDKGFTEEQAHRRIKDGWAIFREHWTRQKIDKKGELFRGRNVDEIKQYCELVTLASISSESQIEEIDRLLLRTSNDPFLDLLINEVDYGWYWDETDNLELIEQVRRELVENLSAWLLDKKNEIDEDLIFCKNGEDLSMVLKRTITDDIGGFPVPVKVFLSESYPAFQQISELMRSIAEVEDCVDIKQRIEMLSDDIENYTTSHSWLFQDSSQP